MKYNKHIYGVLFVALVLLGCQSPINDNGSGEPPVKSPVKPPVKPLVDAQVSAGYSHTIALTKAGQLYAWGRNDKGQLGIGNNGDKTKPHSVTVPLGVKKWTQVSAGVNHTVALTDAGQLYAWGLNDKGQLGTGNNGDKTKPHPVTVPLGVTQWTQVSAGANHTVALTETGQLYAWGDDTDGQLGNGKSGTDKTKPHPVTVPLGVKKWTQVSAGGRHTVALAKTGQLYAWGWNEYGQLGNGESGTDKDTPQKVKVTALPAGTQWTQVSAGGSYTIALTETGQLYAWGYNQFGQLGNGKYSVNTNSKLEKVSLPAGTELKQVSAGTSHAVALTETGQLYAWGWNKYGQLGNEESGTDESGTDERETTPQLISWK